MTSSKGIIGGEMNPLSEKNQPSGKRTENGRLFSKDTKKKRSYLKVLFLT